jgi:GNAT superfamily N-acetyltransferase
VDVYNLWVHPSYRRLGLATRLKKKVEEAAAERGAGLIYAHIEMNRIAFGDVEPLQDPGRFSVPWWWSACVYSAQVGVALTQDSSTGDHCR